MGYCEAMEAAGAKVHDYGTFGDYQGSWWALVTFEGQTGWASGWYGSCSGCDAFEGEFGYENHDHEGEEYFSPLYNTDKLRDDCDKCQDFKRRFVEFGLGYLGDLMTQDEAERHAERDTDWDLNRKETYQFICQHRGLVYDDPNGK